MNYKALLTATKEKIDSMKAGLRAKEMEAKGKLELTKIESELFEADTKIAELKSKYPIDYDAILKAIDKKELLKRREKKFKEILDELFSE